MGFGNGSGYTLNSQITPGTSINNGTLTLTTISQVNQATSAFFNTRQSTGSFTAVFTYQAVGPADGMTFVIQNDPAGLHALRKLTARNTRQMGCQGMNRRDDRGDTAPTSPQAESGA